MHKSKLTPALKVNTPQKTSKMPFTCLIHMTKSADPCVALMKSTNTSRVVSRMSLSSLHGTRFPTKFRDKHKFYALKKQTDTKAGITRWEPQSGTLRDLQYSAALSGLPMSLIHVTPTRAEPYEIEFFDKYKTMDDSISSTGTNVPLDTFPPGITSGTPQTLHPYKARGRLILSSSKSTQDLSNTTLPLSPSHVPLSKRDITTTTSRVTNIGSTSSSSEVVKDILSAKGIPLAPAQPAPSATARSPAPAATGPSSGSSPTPRGDATDEDAIAADADDRRPTRTPWPPDARDATNPSSTLSDDGARPPTMAHDCAITTSHTTSY